MTTIYQILELIVLYGGAVAGFVGALYVVFQFFAKSWIENKFKESLEHYKHEQAVELQRLRVKIDSMLNSVLKLQEKEFETLAEAWRLLDEAFISLSSLVSPIQEYPDLDRMTSAELEEFLTNSKLFDSQKNKIRQLSEKTKTHQEIIFWYRFAAVKKACADLQNYVARQSIFFPLELKDLFSKVSEDMWSALIDKQVGREANDGKMQAGANTTLKEKIEPLYKSIETSIHTRLRTHGRSTLS